MNHQTLIAASRQHLAKYPACIYRPDPVNMFPSGARWMYDRLNELDSRNTRPFNIRTNYNFYGFLKYGICLMGSCLCCWWFLKHAPLLTPLSILCFYLLEIQFLFLFPLLLDNSAKPILTGMHKVLKLGIGKCLFIVIPIAFFMVLGLLKKRNNLKDWYTGCLAILIWYNNEVRTRL